MNLSVVAEVPTQGLSRNTWLELWWGFFWRGLCMLLPSLIVGVLVGIVLGIILGFLGAMFHIPKKTINIVGSAGVITSGLVAGVFIFAYWLRWLLKARFGEYRFALVKDIKSDSIADTSGYSSAGTDNDIFNIPVKL